MNKVIIGQSVSVGWSLQMDKINHLTFVQQGLTFHPTSK